MVIGHPCSYGGGGGGGGVDTPFDPSIVSGPVFGAWPVSGCFRTVYEGGGWKYVRTLHNKNNGTLEKKGDGWGTGSNDRRQMKS